jgi:hypothetical protein
LEGANGIHGAISDQVQRSHRHHVDQRHRLQRWRYQRGHDRPGGGVVITSSTFLTGGFLNTNIISGAANGIGVLSDSTSPARSSTAARSAQLKTAF